jgi:hypothetical protein
MNFDAANLPDLSLAIAILSIVLCPMLCGMMAYRISQEYQLR